MRTVIYSYTLSNGISMIVLMLVWLQNRKRFAGTDFWLANAVMQFAAIFAILLRDVIPSFISIVLGNGLIVGGILLFYIGLEKFVGKQTSQIHNYILLAFFIFIHSYFTFSQPNLQARNINVSLVLFLLFFQVAWLLLRRVPSDLRSITIGVGYTAIAYCLISIARITVDLVIPTGNNFLDSNLYDTLIVLLSQMIFIVLSFGLILMINRRLVENLEQDIMERKRGEAELRESEERFRKQFESTPIPTFTWKYENNTFTLIDFNLAADELSMGNANRFLKMTVEEIYPDRPDILEYFHRCVEERSSIAFETDYLARGTGLNRKIIFTFSYVSSNLVMLHSQDITERVQAEDALREREALYRQMFTNHTAVMLLVEPDSGQIVEANPAAATFYGYPVDRLQQMNIEQINTFTPEKVAKDRDAAASGDQNYFLFSHRLASGEIRDVEVHSVPIQIEGSRLLYSIIHDITERKQAEDALLDSEEKFHTAFHASPVVMSISSLEDGIFMDANAQFFNLTGLKREEAIGRKSTELGIWSDSVRQEISAELKERGFLHNKEVELITKSGQKVPLLWFGDVVHINNKPCLIASGYDLTERKQAEEALQRSEERFRAIFNKSIQFSLILDADGAIIEMNELCYQICGRLAEESLDKPIEDALWWGNDQDVKQKTIAAIREVHNGKAISDEVVFLDKNLSEHNGIRTFSPIFNKNGELAFIAVAGLDITERVKAEKELESTTYFLEESQKIGQFGTWGWNFKTNETWWSENLFEIYGRDQALGIPKTKNDNWLATIHPEDRASLQDAVQTAIEQGSKYETEYRLIRENDGEIRTVFARGKIILDSKGNPERLIGSALDITERKHAEKALEESEHKHRKMIANISDVVAIMDKNGVLQYKSPNIETHFGWHSEDLVGTNGWDTVHPDDLDRIQREFFKLLERKGTTKTVEYRYKRKDGTFSLIELTAVNLTHDPQINGVLINYHDITNRKRVEDELKRQKSFFEQTFIQSATSTQILDQNGWCLRINPKLSELFGVKPEHIEGHVYNIFNDEEIKRNGIDTILKRVFGEQKVEKWEVHFDIGVAADSQNIEVEKKRKVWYANKAYPIIDSKGNVTNVIIQHEDITERKLAEQAVQEALLDKEVLLRELYHRTKNNMQVISSMLNLEIGQTENEELEKTLHDMDNRIRSMALVHQKLYQSQNLSSLDLKDYIGDLASLMLESYQINPGRIDFSLQAESVPVLIDTAIPCGLIVNEILSNALKYAFPDKRKGNIQIRLERAKDATIVLEIRDDGVGVPPDKDLRNSNTLGMQTIFGIAGHQLGANVELETLQGVAWHIQFTDNLYTSRI